MASKSSSPILFPVLDPLRSSGIMLRDATILAFQLLAWADQSAKAKLASADGIDPALRTGANGIIEALEHLAVAGGMLGQAFNNAAVLARLASAHVVAAATAAKRLVDGGIFERFLPADVAADLAPLVDSYDILPGHLVRLLSDLALVDDATSVYCPWEYSGQFIGATLGSDATVHAEAMMPYPLPALVSLFRKGDTSLHVTNPLSHPTAVKAGSLQKFDAVIAFPPFGMKLEADLAARDLHDRFVSPKATATGLILQHIIAQTQSLAAVLVPNSFLFGPGTDREVREHFLRKGVLKAVVALPAGMLSTSNIPMAILLLDAAGNCDTVKFINAMDPHFRSGSSKGRLELQNVAEIVRYCHADGAAMEAVEPVASTRAVSVAVTEILSRDASLQVDRYVMSHERRQLQEVLDAAPTVALEALVKIFAPLPNKDREGNFDGIQVVEVGAVDLPQVGYIKPPARVVSIQLPTRRSGAADDVFLRPFDVVLIIKGSVGKIGIVPEQVPPPGPGGWIAGQSAVVLRAPDSRSDPRALALMLRSRIGQQLLGSIQSGASIPMISLAALRQLAVPVLPEAMARKAIDVLTREARLQQQIDELLGEQSQLADSLWDKLLQP